MSYLDEGGKVIDTMFGLPDKVGFQGAYDAMKPSYRDRESREMGEPQMQWRMVEIGETQPTRDRNRITFVDPEPKGECEYETSDEKAREDREGEPIFLDLHPPVHPNES